MVHENISGDTHHVFLHKNIVGDEVVHAVWRKKMFQFKAIDAGSVVFLDVIIVLILVVRIDDANAEGIGISEGAVIDPVDIKMIREGGIPFGFEHGVNAGEVLVEPTPDLRAINDGSPESIIAIAVVEGHGFGPFPQTGVRNRKFEGPVIIAQVGSQLPPHWIHGLFFRREWVEDRDIRIVHEGLPVTGISGFQGFGVGCEELHGVFDILKVNDFGWRVHVTEGDGNDGRG